MVSFEKNNESPEEAIVSDKESSEKDLTGIIAEDLQVLAKAVHQFDKLAEKAKTPEAKTKVESLRGRALKAAKEFLKISSTATLGSLLALAVDFYATRNTIEKKRDRAGNIEYFHPDPETTHILNVLVGREVLSQYEILKNFRAVLRTLVENKNINLPLEFDEYTLDQMDLYWKNIYGQFKDNRLPYSLKTFFNNSFNLSTIAWQEGNPEIYNMIWKAEEDCGSPNIRFQTHAPGIAGISFGDNISRPYFNPLTNTVYLPLGAFVDSDEEGHQDLLSELSHSKQLNDNPLGFYAKAGSSILRILAKGKFDKDKLSRAQDDEYSILGSLEHEAHSSIEPQLTKKYKDLTKIRGHRYEK